MHDQAGVGGYDDYPEEGYEDDYPEEGYEDDPEY
jgi:hypothetical protein